MATTTTNEVYRLDLRRTNISVFANRNTIDLATGAARSAPALASPDNLAVDHDGNIYIVEDRNGGVDDDIWFARDLNQDGDLTDAGEGLGRWASNGTPGSEFTGLYFDPTDKRRAWVNIQHPASQNDRVIEITTPSVAAQSYLSDEALRNSGAPRWRAGLVDVPFASQAHERLTFGLLLIGTGGTGRHVVDGEVVGLSRGTVVALLPGQLHRHVPDSHCQAVLVLWRGEAAPPGRSLTCGPSGPVFRADEASLDALLAQADLFRIEGGVVVEHWDASAPVAEDRVNDGTNRPAAPSSVRERLAIPTAVLGPC